MIKRKNMPMLTGVLLSLVLTGCTLIPGTPATNSPLENVTEVDEIKDVSDNEDIESNAEGEENESDTEVSEDSNLIGDPKVHAETFYGELSLMQSVGPDGSAVFEVRNILFVKPEDTDLIEKYNLPPDLDGADSEIVYSDEEPLTLLAFEDCEIQIVDWETGSLALKTVTLEEFCTYLKELNRPIYISYEMNDLGTLTVITEYYIA